MTNHQHRHLASSEDVARGFNFGAGPAMLPESILKDAQRDLLDWQHTGMSILEIGHRTPEFRDLLEHASTTLRYLLKIPENYHVLFLGGPARMLFSMIPMNFLSANETADYLVTGIWSAMAWREAQKLKQARCVASGEAGGFKQIPESSSWQRDASAAYFYYTPNETVNGVYCPKPVILDKTPMIADMTSCLLAEPIQIEDYDLIFAGAQKNIANAGLTLVIIRDEFVKTIQQTKLPSIYDFRTHIEHHSLYTTPPTFNCYLASKMFSWVEQQGGVDTLYAINQHKAALLYQFIDESSFYTCSISQPYRSLFNVCFNVPSPTLEKVFIAEAKKRNLHALQGHRLVGGLRASLYNAMPLVGVERLIEFMSDFALRSRP